MNKNIRDLLTTTTLDWWDPMKGIIDKLLTTTILDWWETPYRWMKHMLIWGTTPRTKHTKRVERTILEDTTPEAQIIFPIDVRCPHTD